VIPSAKNTLQHLKRSPDKTSFSMRVHSVLLFSSGTQQCHLGALGSGSFLMIALMTLRCTNVQHVTKAPIKTRMMFFFICLPPYSDDTEMPYLLICILIWIFPVSA